MDKKFITMADKTIDVINSVKNIIKAYENNISDNRLNPNDLENLRKRKTFMEGQLKELQEQLIKYNETNELYYEPGTYEYFKNVFSKIDKCQLDDRFIIEVTCLSDKEIKPSMKGKVLNNICKAYKEIGNIKKI